MIILRENVKGGDAWERLCMECKYYMSGVLSKENVTGGMYENRDFDAWNGNIWMVRCRSRTRMEGCIGKAILMYGRRMSMVIA